MLLRPQRAQARLVVPVPIKGSSTVSPAKENILTKRSANSSGYGAGCCRLDVPGKSDQICRNQAW